MAQAFPGIAELAAGHHPPLEAIAACNQRLLRQCATLRRLALSIGECSVDADAAAAATASLMNFFDHVLPRQHRVLESTVFPEVIESMAGSDAVCLREITDALARQHREISRFWARLRPPLQALASGGATALPVQEIDAFIAHCHATVAREHDELLPMAARLLSDEQLQRIGAALRLEAPGAGC